MKHCLLRLCQSSEHHSDSIDAVEPSDDLPSSLPHQAMETYMCASDHKCYAIRTATHELFLLFSNDVPNYALG